MTKSDLKLIVDFEETHNVERYEVGGWHVWPLMRVALYLGMFPRVGGYRDQIFRRQFERLLWILRKVAGFCYAQLRYMWCVAIIRPIEKGQVLFIVPAQRRVLWGGESHEIYSEHFRERLSSKRVKSVVWETGPRVRVFGSKNRAISGIIHAGARRASMFGYSIDEPLWYRELTPLIYQVIGRDVSWAEMSSFIGHYLRCTNALKKHIEKSQAKLLLVVCWYDPLVMAAVTAAKSLGIKTIELQHGLQGETHNAYSQWSKAPYDGYEAVPDVFFVWGNDSARGLKLNNSENFLRSSEIIISGNPWLNFWLNRQEDSRPVDRKKKIILVTLQLDISNALFRAVESSPEDWVWLFRFHPTRTEAERETDRKKLRQISSAARIEIDSSSAQPLYYLLARCNVHVTEASTCALEAAAFGVPTIILTDSDLGRRGRKAFSVWINRDYMRAVDSSGALLQSIMDISPLDPNAILVKDSFAGNDATESAIDWLCREVWRGCQ